MFFDPNHYKVLKINLLVSFVVKHANECHSFIMKFYY